MPAFVWTLIIYLCLGVSLLGWGIAAARFFRINDQPNCPSFDQVWLGWASALIVLQLVHLILPLTAYVVVPVFALGIVFAFRLIDPKARPVPGRFCASKGVVALGAIVFLSAIWIALRSVSQRPEMYDSGLYYFSAIRWTYSYPVVLGLGNLHGRLAFNSTLFPFVAALDFHPIFDNGHSIANSFLLVLGIASIADLLRPVVDRPSLLVTSHPFRYAAPLFALPPLAYIALTSDLSSPMPDVASSIIQIVLFVKMCDSIGRWREGEITQDYRATLILILAASAVTIKLSNLAFSVGIAGFVAAYWMQTSPNTIRTFVQIFLPAGGVILVWCFRGFLISGAPLYPSTIGYIPVEWAIPRDAVVAEAKSVYTWARKPGAHWSSVLGNWTWLGPWLLKQSEDFDRVVYPLSLSALLCIPAAIITLATKRLSARALEWAILIPPVVGLVYWFLTAPDIRFANAIFFLLAISSCLLFLLSVHPVVSVRTFTAIFCVVFLFGNMHFIQYSIDNKWLLKPCAKEGNWVGCISSTRWRPIKEVPLIALATSSGLEVLSPTTGDQCWDAPLPCTPYFNNALRLREPGLLSSGFVVTTP